MERSFLSIQLTTRRLGLKTAAITSRLTKPRRERLAVERPRSYMDLRVVAKQRL
jgi:hypothetical protein